MRVVDEFTIEDIKVTVYQWNNKYILKYEAGKYEQTYKISEFDITSENDVAIIAKDEIFISQVIDKFRHMNQHLFEAIDRA